MKKPLTIILFALLALSTKSQMTTEWLQKFMSDAWNPDYGGVVHDSTGNIYVVSTEFVSNSLTLSKVDSQGLLQWKKYYGSNVYYEYCRPWRVVYDEAGFIWVLGSEIMLSTDNDIFVYKLDLNGNVVFRYNYTHPGFDFPESCTLAKNGDFIFSAQIEVNSTNFDEYLFRISNSGSLVWAQVLPNADPYWPGKISETASGKIIRYCSGYINTTMYQYYRILDSYGTTIYVDSSANKFYQSGMSDSLGNGAFAYMDGYYNLYLDFRDSLGSVVSVDSIHSTTDSILYPVITIQNGGGYLICYSMGEQCYLRSYDIAGNLLWMNNYQFPPQTATLDVFNMCQRPNGDVYIWGALATTPGFLANDLWVYQLNDSGAVGDFEYLPFGDGANNHQFQDFHWSFDEDNLTLFTDRNPSGVRLKYLVNICLGRCETNISGQVWMDEDQDCIADSAELVVPYSLVQAQPSGNWLVSKENGQFSGIVPYGPSTLTHPLPLYWQHSCPPADSIAFTIDSLNPQANNLDFGVVVPLDIHDLHVTGSSAPVRPGFNTNLFVTYGNSGTEIENGTVVVVLDTIFQYNSSLPSPNQISGDTLFYNFTNLLLFENRNIVINNYVGPNIPIGTSFEISAIVNPILVDTFPDDNTDTISDVVTGALPP